MTFVLNRNNFFVKEIPKISPLSLEYTSYFRDFKRKCIEGYWVGGVWCPGQLYFYLNAWHIKLNAKVTDKNKIIARPFFRELEWEKAYILVEARGFSGFSHDLDHTCLRQYKDEKVLLRDLNGNILISEDIERIKEKEGSEKLAKLKEVKYIPAREYLYRQHTKGNLGKPLFENEAQNVLDLEARESGKSYWASACIAHNFMYDGATDYDEYMRCRKAGTPFISETLVGSIDSKYSSDLLNKVQLGMDSLPGAMEVGGRYYPSPLSVSYDGPWSPGPKPVKSVYERKIEGGWEKGGAGSLLHHRSFSDNHLAANGTRPNLSYLEEVGFQHNLVETLGAMRDVTTNSGVKFGTIYMMGTGGENDAKAIKPIQDVFYDPETYDCLVFKDEWEGRGKICYFCPPTKADNEFLDKETGKIDSDKALGKYLKRREKLAKGNNKRPYDDELRNKPLKPSEIFLLAEGNKFPVEELKAHLAYLEASTDGNLLGTKGNMVYDQNGNLEFKPDLENKLRQCDFPVDKNDNKGCVVIWQHPELNNLGYYLYVLGTDPYAQDKAETSASLGAVYVIKRGQGLEPDVVVAEYVGRPSVDEFSEITLRLNKYYGGLNLYENNVNTLKTFYERNNSLHLLAKNPNIFKSSSTSVVSTIYGVRMNKTVVNGGFVGTKPEMEMYLDQWLRTKVGDKLQLHFIFSKPLLKELIQYESEGNYDRAIALMCAHAQSLQMFRMKADAYKESKKIDPFFTRKLNR